MIEIENKRLNKKGATHEKGATHKKGTKKRKKDACSRTSNCFSTNKKSIGKRNFCPQEPR